MRKKFNKKYPSVYVEDGYHKVILPNGLSLPHLIKTETICSVDETKLKFEILFDKEHKPKSSLVRVSKVLGCVIVTLPCGFAAEFLEEGCKIIEDEKYNYLQVELQDVNIVSSKLQAFEFYGL